MSKISRLRITLCLLGFIAIGAAQNPPNVCMNPPANADIRKDISNLTYGNLLINNASKVVIFENLNYGCVPKSLPGDCSVNIFADTICFMNNVALLYPLIVLNASKIYIKNSNVNSSGMILKGIVNQTDPDVGYSFAGFGGYCGSSIGPSYAYSQNFLTYGDYDDLWNISESLKTYGTGNDTDSGFAGGGKIVIQAVDSLEIVSSQVSATGVANCSENLHGRARGGTGGYIFISMLNDSGVLNLNTSFFNVSGGAACDNSKSSLAGSGGRLVFDLNANIERLNFSIDGGYTALNSELRCQLAAPGTAYNFRNQTLVIRRQADTYYPQSNAMTFIKQETVVDNLVAEGMVWIISNSNNKSSINVTRLYLSNGAIITPNFNQLYGNKFSIAAKRQIILRNNSAIKFMPTAVVSIECAAMSLQANSVIEGPRIYITTALNETDHVIEINNSYIQATAVTIMPTAIFLYSNQILLTGASLTANYIHMLAVSATYQGKTAINALQISCKGDLKAWIHHPILSSYKVQNTTGSHFNVSQVMRVLLNRSVSVFPSHKDFFEFAGRLSSDYTLILIATNKVALQTGSQIIGSRIGVFGDQISINAGASVTSNARGCKGGTGFSSGLKDDQFASSCGGSGGSHGGIGGIGSSSELNKDANCQKMKTYPYGNPFNPILEGSGGSSNTSRCYGGSGGGVVIIGAYQLVINGTVSSNGREGALKPGSPPGVINDCGGGSGGSIQIHSLSRFTGYGNISAKGGNQIGNGGAGGAGRILLNYYGWFRNESVLDVFRGNITASIGDRADTSTVLNYSFGTVYSNPCLPGHYGLYCQPCPVGTYKDDFSNDECKNCSNLPERSKPDTENGWNGTSSICPYICEDKTVQDGARTICVNYFQYYTRYVGGLPGVSILVFFCVILFGLVLHKSSNKKSRKAQMLQNSSRGTNAHKSILEKKDLDELKKSSLKPDFVMEDLPYHTARIYLKGCNHTTQSWYLSDEIPSSLRDKVDETKYAEFIQEINSRCLWTNAEIVLISLSEIIYYPIYAWLLKNKKRKVLQKLQNYLGASKRDIWKDMRARELSYTIKLSSSPDYSLAYLDILNYDYSVLEWENTTKFPISIILSGEGNFLSPYQINTMDPLVKSVSLSLKQIVGLEAKDDFELEGRRHSQEEQNLKRMELFLMTFNTLIREIDHAAPESHFLASIQKLLKYIRTANIKFFNNSKIETELRFHLCPRDNDEQPIVSYGLNLLDKNLEELLSNFRRIKRNSGTYDVQLSINFSRGEDIPLSKQTGPRADELDEEEEKSETNEDPFTEEYKDLSYDIFPSRKNSRLDLLDPETQELLDLKQKLLKKIETQRRNIQAIMIETEMTQLTLPKEGLNQKWQKLRRTVGLVETVRYFLISFRPKKFDKYFITIIMSILVVLDLIYTLNLISLFDIELFIFLLLPYPLSPFSPFFGLLSLLLTSQNKLGKFFLMLNAMSISNMVLSLVLFFIIKPNILQFLEIVAKILICVFGCHYISYLEHLKCLSDLERFLE